MDGALHFLSSSAVRPPNFWCGSEQGTHSEQQDGNTVMKSHQAKAAHFHK